MIQPSEPVFPSNWEDFITDEPVMANNDLDIGQFAPAQPPVRHEQATNGHQQQTFTQQKPEANNEEFDLDALARQAIVTPQKNISKSPSSDYIHLTRHTPHWWLDRYIAYSQERSPRGYSTLHELSGVFALSAAVGGRVRVSYVRWHSTALYFLACARSTRYAKTTTVKVARKVLDKAGQRWRFGPDTMTPQLMLSFMSDKEDNEESGTTHAQKRQKARKYHEGQMAWIYDEFSQKLSSMLKDSGPYAEFHGILRKINEEPDSYEYGTRSYGFEHVSYPCLTLFGLTTPDELRQFGQAGGQLWTDGFFARFLMVGPSPHDKPQLTPPEEVIPPVPYELLKPLADMNQSLGFRDSYESPLPIIRMNPPHDIKMLFHKYEVYLAERCKQDDLSASYQRIAVEHCPKIAALLAVVDGHDNIGMTHAYRAIEIGEKVRYGLDSLYKGLTTYTNTEKQKRQSQKEEKIIGILEKSSKPMTVSQIRVLTGRSTKYRMSNEDTLNVLGTLSDSGIATFEMKRKKQYWSLISDSV